MLIPIPGNNIISSNDLYNFSESDWVVGILSLPQIHVTYAELPDGGRGAGLGDINPSIH